MAERGAAIVLIGFMGAGKSSAGRALARRTRLPLFDTDALVSERLGMSIAEIFAQRGEDEFRAQETATLLAISPAPSVVVTGGGVVLRSENVTAMKQLGIVVHLTADEETLFERATRRAIRPLLQTADPRATFAELLHARAPLYESAADVVVDTAGKRHEEVVTAVLEAVANLGSHVG
jgi:shikimate kinase